MEKRFLLVVVLCTAVLILWNHFYLSRINKNRVSIQTEITTSAVPSSSVLQKTPPTSGKLFTINNSNVEIKDIIIETELMELVLTNKGGQIKNLKLKKHLSSDNKILDLINSADIVSALSLVTNDPEINYFLNNLVYTPSETRIVLDEQNPVAKLELKYSDESGINLSKVLIFNNQSYGVEYKIQIENLPLKEQEDFIHVFWGAGLGRADKSDYSKEVVSFIDGKRIVDAPKKIEKEIIRKGNLSWVSILNKYFIVGLIPKNKTAYSVVNKTDKESIIGLGFIPSARISEEFILYAGPKDEAQLSKYSVGLEKAISYGWFGDFFTALNKPINLCLKFLYRFTFNYGLAIIVLTIIVKMLLYPLSYKSFSSMKAMQKIQPEVKILQERYKDDKQALNMEMLKLYKEKKINPLGGCLPMILQIPIFIALYNVLSVSIELRHANFLWLVDLSEKDPIYITPILMGITMFIQQKMTPSMGDPTQAKMMMFMPIIFTVMFLSLPSGLVLYWLVSNLMTIGQQYFISKKVK